MALETRLVIKGIDETGSAFTSLKAQIAALDKQIAVFDKMAASAGKVAAANDPMIKSIAASSAALNAQRASVAGLSAVTSELVGPTERAAAAQGMLAAETARTTGVMIAQGAEAARVSGLIVAAQRRQVVGARTAAAGGAGMLGAVGGGLGGMIIGTGLFIGAADALKAGATLEQTRIRLKAVSGGNAGEMAFADQLTRDIAAKFPIITEAKALDTYLEIRANALTQTGEIDKERARRNLMAASQAQVAMAGAGSQLTPEDTQNLLKAVEGLGQAGDPHAFEKILSLYVRGKPFFGSALTSEMMKTFVQNVKSAGFGLSDEAFARFMVQMTETNAARLGNEASQVMQTLVGGHMTKQTGLWLQKLHLIKGLRSQGGGKVTATGLTGADLLLTDQSAWANQILLPAIEKTGALSEKTVKARMDLLRKQAIKAKTPVDEAALRERAESGLVAQALAQSGMRTTVTDELVHYIVNKLLQERDVAGLMKGYSPEAAAALVRENPVAAFNELKASISNFMAVAADPAMIAAAHGLDELARAISAFTGMYHDFEKAHPGAAKAIPEIAGPLAAAFGTTLALGAVAKTFQVLLSPFAGLGRLVGIGGAGAGGAAAGVGETAATGGGMSLLGILRGGPSAATAYLAWRWLTGAKPGPESRRLARDLGLEGERGTHAPPPGPIRSVRVSPSGTPIPPARPGVLPSLGAGIPPSWPGARALAGPPMELFGARPAQGVGVMVAPNLNLPGAPVSFTGNAQVEQTFSIDITLDPEIRARIDALKALDFQVPLDALMGRMDSDASPRRYGVGHQ